VVRVVVMFSYSAREPKLSNKLLFETLSFETQIELMNRRFISLRNLLIMLLPSDFFFLLPIHETTRFWGDCP
jgi:hypothetical protein